MGLLHEAVGEWMDASLAVNAAIGIDPQPMYKDEDSAIDKELARLAAAGLLSGPASKPPAGASPR